MKSIKANPGEYRVESSAGIFILRKLPSVASTDYQWGVFTEDGKILHFGYTKGDCQCAVETWEQGKPIPPAEDYNLKYPPYIGSKRIASGTYRMATPVGVFIIRKFPDRKRGEFQWGIFSEQAEFLADNLTRADCESLVRDWVTHGRCPSAASRATPTGASSCSKSGCLSCIALLVSFAYTLVVLLHMAFYASIR